MKRIILAIILSIAFSSIFAQKKINYYQFHDLLRTQQIIENYEIVESYLIDPSLKFSHIDEPIITENRIIRNCTFHNFRIVGLSLSGSLVIDNCKLVSDSYKNSIGYDMEFIQCNIKGDIILSSNSNLSQECYISLSNSTINSLIIVDETLNPNFNTTSSLSINQSTLNGTIIIWNNAKLTSLRSTSTTYGWPMYFKALFGSGDADFIRFRECTFNDDVCLDKLHIKNDLIIKDCIFNKDISMSGVRFDMGKADLDWRKIISSIDSVSSVRFILGNENSGYISSQGFKRIIQSDHINSYQVENSYRVIIGYLRDLNLRNEADSCYVIYRTYETNTLFKAWVHNKKDINLFINFIVSKTLNWYSSYSTDFIKALKNTVLIILFFAFLYLVQQLLSFRVNYKCGILLTTYALTKKNKHFRQKFAVSLSTFKRKEQEIFSLMKSNSFLAILWLLFVKPILKSVMVSINFFVTLGYGGVQANGKMKYIAIIEGLVGWFVLIMFTSCMLTKYIEIS